MRRVAVIAFAALAVVSCANEAFINDVERAPNGELIDGGRLGTTNLRAGDCFNERSSSTVRSVDAVLCDEPHRGQVVGRALAEPHHGWPGVAPLTEEAGELCAGLVGDFLAPGVDQLADLPQLDLTAYIPDEPAWEDGDRSVICWIETAERVTRDLRTAIGA